MWVANDRKDHLVADVLNLPSETFDLEPISRQPLPGLHRRTRAFIKVQDGCDNQCTFCITTVARGEGRSRRIAEVILDIQSALAGGTKEIVLTGVHLGSWGYDFDSHLSELIQAILRETNVPRLRLSSLEPWDLSVNFFSLWEDARLVPHLHLPLQSGCEWLVTAGLTAATLVGLAISLRALGGGGYEGARLASEMGLLRPASEGATVLPELPAEPPAQPQEGASILETVRARGRIRVGFILNQRPYSHVNARGELVGFDVEMAHALARELGVAVEFAPVARDRFEEALEAGRVDVLMAGVLLTTRRASRVESSPPYLDETLAFVVPDHRRAEFSDAEWVRAQAGLRVGVPDLPYVRQLAEREFPNLTIVHHLPQQFLHRL